MIYQQLRTAVSTEQIQDLGLDFTLIQRLSQKEVLDRVFDAWDRWDRKCPRHRAMERKEYNWWVDVYNFKAGKLILQNK